MMKKQTFFLGGGFSFNFANFSFQKLKQELTQAPILSYPHPGDLFIVDTDASAEGIGAVLSHLQDGQERVISYFRKVLS